MSDKLPPELTGKEQWQKFNGVNADLRLTSDQRAQLYLELYKQQMAYFHETRRIEFQANLALWGAIFAVGYALAGKASLGGPLPGLRHRHGLAQWSLGLVSTEYKEF